MALRTLKSLLLIILCGVLTWGAASGISTSSQIAARTVLRQAETAGHQLFYAPTLGVNGFSCDDCHRDGGRFSHRLGDHRIPGLVDAKTLFPKVMAHGQIITLPMQMNQCIVGRMKGRALSLRSRRLALLDLYIRHLSRFHER